LKQFRAYEPQTKVVFKARNGLDGCNLNNSRHIDAS
jgi:hypothetical protein